MLCILNKFYYCISLLEEITESGESSRAEYDICAILMETELHLYLSSLETFIINT